MVYLFRTVTVVGDFEKAWELCVEMAEFVKKNYNAIPPKAE